MLHCVHCVKTKWALFCGSLGRSDTFYFTSFDPLLIIKLCLIAVNCCPVTQFPQTWGKPGWLQSHVNTHTHTHTHTGINDQVTLISREHHISNYSLDATKFVFSHFRADDLSWLHMWNSSSPQWDYNLGLLLLLLTNEQKYVQTCFNLKLLRLHKHSI